MVSRRHAEQAKRPGYAKRERACGGAKQAKRERACGGARLAKRERACGGARLAKRERACGGAKLAKRERACGGAKQAKRERGAYEVPVRVRLSRPADRELYLVPAGPEGGQALLEPSQALLEPYQALLEPYYEGGQAQWRYRTGDSRGW